MKHYSYSAALCPNWQHNIKREKLNSSLKFLHEQNQFYKLFTLMPFYMDAAKSRKNAKQASLWIKTNMVAALSIIMILCCTLLYAPFIVRHRYNHLSDCCCMCEGREITTESRLCSSTSVRLSGYETPGWVVVFNLADSCWDLNTLWDKAKSRMNTSNPCLINTASSDRIRARPIYRLILLAYQYVQCPICTDFFSKFNTYVHFLLFYYL